MMILSIRYLLEEGCFLLYNFFVFIIKVRYGSLDDN